MTIATRAESTEAVTDERTDPQADYDETAAAAKARISELKAE